MTHLKSLLCVKSSYQRTQNMKFINIFEKLLKMNYSYEVFQPDTINWKSILIFSKDGEKSNKVAHLKEWSCKTWWIFMKGWVYRCIGPTDCVHTKWGRCPVSLTHLCKGKEEYSPLAYSCTVDHHRRILGVSPPNYGTRNDKTIFRLDAVRSETK